MSNKASGLLHRSLVLAVLEDHGLNVMRRPERRLKPSEVLALDPEPERGDVQGLSRWALMTRAENVRDLSTALDRAKTVAALDGKQFSATVWSRPERPAEESFVIMSLGDFAAVVAELEGPEP